MKISWSSPKQKSYFTQQSPEQSHIYLYHIKRAPKCLLKVFAVLKIQFDYSQDNKGQQSGIFWTFEMPGVFLKYQGCFHRILPIKNKTDIEVVATWKVHCSNSMDNTHLLNFQERRHILDRQTSAEYNGVVLLGLMSMPPYLH